MINNLQVGDKVAIKRNRPGGYVDTLGMSTIKSIGARKIILENGQSFNTRTLIEWGATPERGVGCSYARRIEKHVE